MFNTGIQGTSAFGTMPPAEVSASPKFGAFAGGMPKRKKYKTGAHELFATGQTTDPGIANETMMGGANVGVPLELLKGNPDIGRAAERAFKSASNPWR